PPRPPSEPRSERSDTNTASLSKHSPTTPTCTRPTSPASNAAETTQPSERSTNSPPPSTSDSQTSYAKPKHPPQHKTTKHNQPAKAVARSAAGTDAPAPTGGGRALTFETQPKPA